MTKLLLSVLVACLLFYVNSQGEEEEVDSVIKPKYFFSVMVMERNQVSLLLEFVRHYLEEGADHLFIYNSQDIPHIHHELDCIDSKFYTIIPHLGDTTTKNDSRIIRQEVFKMVRDHTEWLAIVDSDDFISSRAYPMKTVREVLESGNHAVCSVIAVPTLNYAWGNTKDTPTGKLRTSLIDRWGYSSQFNYSSEIKAAKSSKFTDNFQKTKNKVIVRAKHVATIRSNTATLYKKNYICVSSTAQYPSCAAFAQDQPSMPLESGANQSPVTAPGGGTAHPVHLLSRYCPERNTYRNKRSSSSMHLQEEDIQGMSLMVHHYRIASQTEWDSLVAAFPLSYLPSEEKLANRADVVDRFMLDREDQRKYHVLQRGAEQILAKCDQQQRSGSALNQANAATQDTQSVKLDASYQPGDVKNLDVLNQPKQPSQPVVVQPSGGIDGIAADQRPPTTLMQLLKSFLGKYL